MMRKKSLLTKSISLLIVIAMTISICPALFQKAGAYNYIAYGIDTSKWQGDVDWCAVKASGIDFVIMRVGTSRNVKGGELDSKFEQNYAGAKLAGLNVGVYFYSCAMSTAEATTEANNVVKWIAGKRFEYPIYIDMEDSCQLSLTTAVRTNICVSFNTVLEKAGYMTGVYANTNWLTNYLDRATIASKYSLWEAVWTKSGTPESDRSDVRNVWQYTNVGRVGGISGDVDRDVSYVDYPTQIRSKGLNGFPKNSPKDTVRGYYKTTDNLNLRSGAGTSNSIITTIPAGTKIALTEINSNGSWAKVTYGSKTGWVSTSYLSFVEYFKYNVKYELGHPDAKGSANPATVLQNFSTTVGSSSVNVNGVLPMGWSLKRSSDNSWYVEGTGWVKDENISKYTKKLYSTGSTLTFNTSIINTATADDTYTFYAEWSAAVNFRGIGFYKVVPSGGARVTNNPGSTKPISTIPGGTVVPLTKVTDDKTFGYVIYHGVNGWVSLSDLTYSSEFVYTVIYETDSTDSIPDATVTLGGEVVLGGENLTEEKRSFVGWRLKRSSDSAWYTTDGTWVTDADESEKALLKAGDTFKIDESCVNYLKGNDTFVLSAVWENIVVPGDADSNGNVNIADVLRIRQYLVGIVSEDEINFANADVDHNGTLNTADVLAIRQYLVGLREFD